MSLFESCSLPEPTSRGFRFLSDVAGAFIFLQDLIAAAQYWHDPLNHTNYASGSHYLALVNNEGEEKEELYKARMLQAIHINVQPLFIKFDLQSLLQLENFVMLKWTEDETVIPRESRFNHLLVIKYQWIIIIINHK